MGESKSMSEMNDNLNTNEEKGSQFLNQTNKNVPKSSTISINTHVHYNKLKSRLIHKASHSNFVYNPLTQGFKRVTRNQQLALKRKQPIRLEPLPRLKKFQCINQLSHIQNRNGDALLLKKNR